MSKLVPREQRWDLEHPEVGALACGKSGGSSRKITQISAAVSKICQNYYYHGREFLRMKAMDHYAASEFGCSNTS